MIVCFICRWVTAGSVRSPVLTVIRPTAWSGTWRSTWSSTPEKNLTSASTVARHSHAGPPYASTASSTAAEGFTHSLRRYSALLKLGLVIYFRGIFCYIWRKSFAVPTTIIKSNALRLLQACNKSVQSFHLARIQWLNSLPARAPDSLQKCGGVVQG